MNEDTIQRYVDAATEQLFRHGLRKTPGQVPVQMRDDSIQSNNDWTGWKPIPSTVTDANLDELQAAFDAHFPPAYRSFLKYQHFYELSEIGVSFYKHPIDTWERILLNQYSNWQPERITGIGLIPFGEESLMDAGPVCFDTRSALPDGDYPVVFWDHEWVGTDQEIRPMFSSCMKMFECLLIGVLSDIDFVYHDEDDSPNQLPLKREVMGQFLNNDPDGAGGPAREYWTSWGVNPDI